MATKRTTFAKTQRERDKKAKAEAKREKRLTRSEEEPEVDTGHQDDPQRVMLELAQLHERYESGLVSLDDFVARREELQSRMVIR